MIAKEVPKRKATSNFHRLGHYILDTRNKGRKVETVRVSNCISDDPVWAIEEVMATQALNTRSKNDKTYHLVVSFPDGERPTPEQLHNIEDSLVAALGLSEHQRISALHKDTDNVHLHIAINKIHTQTRRCIEPFYSQYRLDEACRELERRHGLQPDNRIDRSRIKTKTPSYRITQKPKFDHKSEMVRKRPEHLTSIHLRHLSDLHLSRPQTQERKVQPHDEQIQQSNRNAKQNNSKLASRFSPPPSGERLRDLSERYLDAVESSSRMLLREDSRDCVELPQEGRDDRLRGLRRISPGNGGARRGGKVTVAEASELSSHKSKLTGRAADLEAHAGESSFFRWVQEEAGQTLQNAFAQATNWEEIHISCAQFGLEIRPRGAGLVIKDRNSKVAMKASQLARNLIKKLGPYQPPSVAVGQITPQKQYTRQPLQKTPGTSGLYAEFQKERNSALEVRANSRKEGSGHREELLRWYAKRRSLIKSSVTMSRGEKKGGIYRLS